METFEITESFTAPANVVYHDLLDAMAHTEIIGDSAEIKNKVGAAFRLWDGYITGSNIELEPNARIVQYWRTTDFPAGTPDSLVETVFARTGEGCAVTIKHSGIPEGQGDRYKKGWIDFYFTPMKRRYAK